MALWRCANAVVDLCVYRSRAGSDGVSTLARPPSGLEAALERGSFSMYLRYSSMVVARRAQLAAGEERLEHVRRVHGSLGLAGADDRVQLVHEQMIWPSLS